MEVFKTRTRQEWSKIMEGTDICFAPVLDYTEAPEHPHNVERQTYINVNGIQQPAPAPRFSRTDSSKPESPRKEGEDTNNVLMGAGFDSDSTNALRSKGVLS